MKKSMIAIAVSSAAFAAPTLYAEEGVEIYGNIQTVYAIEDTATDDESQLTDNGSTFGFEGEKELKGGVTGFFKYELEAEADEKNDDVSVSLDQAYIGATGGFGKVQIGSFDSIYNNAIQDAIDQFEYLGFTGVETTEEGDTVAYFSPIIGGLEAHISAQTKGSAEEGSDETVSDTALSSVIKYSSGELFVAFGYDSLTNDSDNAPEAFGIGAGYGPVSFKYETQGDDVVLGLSANVPYSAGSIYGSYQTIDLDDASSEDYDEFGVGVSYNLDVEGDVYVYAELGQTGEDESDVTAVGAVYAF